MALATHTLSINPAFLQEIKDDHHELRQLMHHTRAMLERSGQMRIELDRLAKLFASLRDQLAMHFSLEEAYGYFEDAIREAPRLNRLAERLRAQHGDLYSDVSQLTEFAENLLFDQSPKRGLGELADRYFEFSMTFQEHEARECEMILAAINDDLGAGD